MPYSMCNRCRKLRPLGTACPCRASAPRKHKSKNTRVKGKYDAQWRKVRAQAIALHPFCLNCGSTEDLTGDHIRPLDQGGTNTLDNVQVLCRSCNSSREQAIRKLRRTPQ
ncbi:HNH endonuclease signature motif containing protein [Streptomyces sp. DH10]|uniref:HNH endonuclease signature motif containing protein n=1 Tax=Streptomyces sp. DH10 TaxID=3040121 RepID=UPI003014C8D8